MAEFPALPFYTDVFIADTMHLSAEETGAYLMLLMVAWRTPDCALPDDNKKLARFARCDTRRWKAIKDEVMAFWTLGANKKWTQKKLLAVRKSVRERTAKAQQAANARWLNLNDTGNASASRGHMPDKCSGDATKTKTKEEYNSSPPIPSSRASDDGGGQVNFDDLREQVFDALGFDDSQLPNWATLGTTLHRLIGAGCTEHDILDAAKQARASTEGKEPPGSPKYLEKIAARIRDERTAPVTAAPRRNHEPAPDAFPPEEQPWMKLRAELTSRGDPDSIAKREELKAAFKSGGDEAANELAEEFTKPKETA